MTRRNRTLFKVVSRAMAMSAMTHVLLPVSVAWAADEVQVVRQSSGGNVSRGVVPFTTFQQEELAVTGSLPCKWISKDGRVGPSYGGGRYDFLCKGGDFATVSLYLDKAGGAADGVGKVRLLYRDWPAHANPNAGEALIAQQFLAHVVGRFVPASEAADVMDVFWTRKSRSWSENGVRIAFKIEKGDQFDIRRLEIEGTGRGLSTSTVAAPVAVQADVPRDAGLAKAEGEAPTKVLIYDKDGKLMDAPERVVPGVAVTKAPVVTPTDAGLAKPQVVVPVPANVLPAPASVPVVKPVEQLVVPANAPASAPKVESEKALQPASPAELNTAPAPESKVLPVAPPELSATLVPSTADLVGGRQRAPTNFDAYNRAVELTKDLEAKAEIAKVEQAKVTASKPTSTTLAVSGTTLVTPSAVVVPPLKAVPTPGESAVDATIPGRAPATPATSEGEGLGLKTMPTVDEVPLPVNYQGPRSQDVRPLPQLKFVPKAEPLGRPDEVIQFEDEKSSL